MLSEALILGAVAGLICKGSFKNLLAQDIKGIYLVLISAATDIFLSSRFALSLNGSRAAVFSLLIVQCFTFIAFAILNRKFFPMYLIALGEILNFIAIAANGGRMPISDQLISIAPDSSSTALLIAGKIPHYILINPSTHVGFLGDIIYFHGISVGMISIGDIIMSVGGMIFLFLLFQKPKAYKH